MNLMRRSFFFLSFVVLVPNLFCLARSSKAVVPSAPTITSVQWDPVGMGGTQCANGTGFGSASATITLNGSNLTPSLWTDTQSCVVIPSDTPAGTANLQVINGGGSSNAVSFTVTTSVAAIAGISPGTAGAGVPVTITGTNFGSSQGNSLVQIQGLSFEISTWSDTQIVATVPNGIPPGGIYAVNVTVAGVTASVGLTIVGTPQVSSVQWDPVGVTGTQCAGGTGFGSSAGTINLEGSSLTPSLWSDTQACLTIPASTAAGAATLQVVNGAGPGNSVGFTVTTAIPAVNGINPAAAGAGVPVTITGTNFGGAQGNSLVQVQGQSFSISNWSDTQIVATVPSGIPPGGGYTVNVIVNGVTASTGLTIAPPPQVTSVQWDPVGTSGTQCVNGTGFGNSSATIALNGSNLTPSLWTDTRACAVIPSGTAAGMATLQVGNAGGASNAVSFTVTASVVTVAGISPATAGTGVPVTISGTNFGSSQGNSLVQLQGQSFPVSTWSDTQIAATVPSGIPPGGIYPVQVTVAGVTASGGLTIVGAPQVTSVQWNPAGVTGTQCANGTGFGSSAGTINLNGANLMPSLWSDTQACMVIPTDTAAGAATLQMVNGAGPGNSVSFTVTTAVPVVTGISPGTAGAGVPVTITGANFGSSQGNGSVQLQGQSFSVSNWRDTQIVATVPSGILPGSYSVNVIVNGVTASGGLTIAAFPQIASLSPTNGAPGALITITGSNFGSGAGTARFDGSASAILNWSDTSIATAVPSGAFTGNVVVTTAAGLSSNGVNFTVLSTNPALDPDIVNRIATIDAGHVSNSIQTLANFGTRNTCSSNLGGASGIGAARDWLSGQFSGLPGVHVSLFNFTTTTCGAARTLQDVVAWIPGAGHPNRLIVIGGHYDSRTVNVTDGISPAPGANDSGSQTSVVLEAARVLAGGSYDATIVFVSWAGEEQGLLGSAAFAQNYRSMFPSGTIELNLNCDIVGGDNTANTGAALQQFRLFSPGTPREISSNAVGSTDNTSPSRLVMHYVGDWSSRYVPDMAMLPNLREDRPGRGSDHESFLASAIPGVRFIDPLENINHQHTGNDLFTFVTPAYTARIARVVTATAAALARAPTPPQSFTATLVNSDAVRATWAAPRSGPVAHYVISARPVTENFYHTRITIDRSQTSAQVRINEDLGIPAGVNFFISVAAVDAYGHESLYAYPEYRCTSTSCVVPTGALNVTATR